MEGFKGPEIGFSKEEEMEIQERIEISRAYFADMLEEAQFSLKNREIILFEVEKILREVHDEMKIEERLWDIEKYIQAIGNGRKAIQIHDPSMDWEPEEMEKEIEMCKKRLEVIVGVELEKEDNTVSRRNIQ